MGSCAIALKAPKAGDHDLTHPRVSRALRYPYDIPDAAYCLRGGEVVAFRADDRAGRTPVLAYGSNQSPERLQQKFPRADAVVPVQRGHLADHDVVFAAHLAIYGSVPASLRYVIGTTVAVAVTWLDDRQLLAMHQTEVPSGNYDYGRLYGVELTLDDGFEVAGVGAYFGARGHLAIDGAPVALSAVVATGRQFTAMSQESVLEHVRGQLAPDASLAAFVHETAERDDLRRERIAILQGQSLAAARAPDAVVHTD